MNRTSVKAFALGLAIAWFALASDAFAIPSFSRKYDTNCQTCHTAPSRLNGYGESFRLRGYKFDNDPEMTWDKPIKLGSDGYRELWPDAVWPADMPTLPPIGVQAVGKLDVDTGGTKDARTSFDAPSEMNLLSGGSLGDSASFFAKVNFKQNQNPVLSGWITIEDFFTEDAFNLKLGTINTNSLGLFTHRNSSRLTAEPYLYQDAMLPASPGVAAGNDFALSEEQVGLELYGFGSSWRYALGMVNGNGTGGDDNTDKDYFAQLGFKIGGLNYDSLSAPPADEMETWVDDSLTLSAFAYRGTASVGALVADHQSVRDNFIKYGAGAIWRIGGFELGGGYVRGSHSRPYAPLTRRPAEAWGFLAETSLYILPWFVPTFRYEDWSLELPTGSGVFNENQDIAQIIVSLKFLLRSNVSLTVDAKVMTRNEPSGDLPATGETNDGNHVLFVLDISF
ncbi:MAG: hypothetical protein NUW37_19625 [Planctomycetes bacterium]|nr:hypothetical protein [Planctomycetota bacterium]